ncbi:MAG: hypothetical protein GEV28_18825 [Actinophytocola sp.]|uniref:hypothetical protein n=1 Tax=Actinophytocola sp. TaxID=1872138 RepID=UPI001328327C|nr:hypothetical protein [Actinophytocola sp.]MPZ82335.1 hypothetical protein [Actinophytocola sp.]
MTDVADAAFGHRPDLVITRTPTDPRERWLAAVVLGGQGRYAAAATVLDGLRGHPDPVLAALACATLASHRRQLGGHATARVLDAEGHARLAGLADTPGIAEARSDVLLGLAADAVGAARLGEARRLVATARSRGAGWRAAVRTDWVSAEIELSAARAEEAVPYAERAAVRAGQEGSVRHRIKSSMVLGAALAARGTTGRAERIVRQALADATDLGLLSLVWPGALIMAELDATRADEFCRCAGLVLQSVLRRTDPIGRRLAERSPWVPRLAGPTG